MRKNVGKIDSTLRGIAGLAIIILYFTNVIQGQTAAILGIIAAVMLFTSFTKFCPCYVRLNINTSHKTNTD